MKTKILILLLVSNTLIAQNQNFVGTNVGVMYITSNNVKTYNNVYRTMPGLTLNAEFGRQLQLKNNNIQFSIGLSYDNFILNNRNSIIGIPEDAYVAENKIQNLSTQLKAVYDIVLKHNTYFSIGLMFEKPIITKYHLSMVTYYGHTEEKETEDIETKTKNMLSNFNYATLYTSVGYRKKIKENYVGMFHVLIPMNSIPQDVLYNTYNTTNKSFPFKLQLGVQYLIKN